VSAEELVGSVDEVEAQGSDGSLADQPVAAIRVFGGSKRYRHRVTVRGQKFRVVAALRVTSGRVMVLL